MFPYLLQAIVFTTTKNLRDTALRKTSYNAMTASIQNTAPKIPGDEGSNHEGHVLFCTETRTQVGMKYRSLVLLLSDTRSQIGDQRLSRDNCLEIVVTLVSSVLQLDGSRR